VFIIATDEYDAGRLVVSSPDGIIIKRSVVIFGVPLVVSQVHVNRWKFDRVV
jgi:hypothetical protein